MSDRAVTPPLAGPAADHSGPGRSPAAVIGGCVAVALVLAGWLLWTRADPARQGGYCANATIAVAGLLNGPAPDGADDPELAALVTDPDSIEGRLGSRLEALDVDRLQVRTPPEVRADVDRLARALDGGDRLAAAASFGRVIADYEHRCLYQ